MPSVCLKMSTSSLFAIFQVSSQLHQTNMHPIINWTPNSLDESHRQHPNSKTDSFKSPFILVQHSSVSKSVVYVDHLHNLPVYMFTQSTMEIPYKSSLLTFLISLVSHYKCSRNTVQRQHALVSVLRRNQSVYIVSLKELNIKKMNTSNQTHSYLKAASLYDFNL